MFQNLVGHTASKTVQILDVCERLQVFKVQTEYRFSNKQVSHGVHVLAGPACWSPLMHCDISRRCVEWEECQKTRQLEMEVCSKALAVLSFDDDHDVSARTFNPAFVQVESKVRS